MVSLDTSRPTTFVHVDMMKLASVFVTEGMLSFECITNCFVAFWTLPPPPQWRNNFSEALRMFMCFQHYMKYGKTESDIASGDRKCFFKCPACFSSVDNGTVIMVISF